MLLKKVTLIIVVSACTHAFVSDLTLKKVEQQYGKFAQNRFVALQKLIIELTNQTTIQKLTRVNSFFNGVRYGTDASVYGVSDYWATPFEFLARDRGDCEDYVIAKYFTLLELGIPSNKLFFTYARVKGYDEAHMVLTYFDTPSSEPLILDNINKKLLLASQRTDLTPVYHFNPNILKDGQKTTAHRKWDELIKRMKENKI